MPYNGGSTFLLNIQISVQSPELENQIRQGLKKCRTPYFVTPSNSGADLQITDQLQWQAPVTLVVRDQWTTLELESAFSGERQVTLMQSHQVTTDLPIEIDRLNDLLLQEESQKKLIRSAAQNLRDLEHLNRDLESMVLERTQHIRKSKEEEDEKSVRFRELILYVIEIAKAFSPEDLLLSFRKSLRKLPGFSSCFLWIGNQILAVRSGDVLRLDANLNPPQTRGVVMDRNLSVTMAQIFQRPVLPIVAATLYSPDVLLGVEADLENSRTEDLVSYFEERAHPMGVALQRVINEAEIERGARRWEKTFDSLREPIAIVSESWELVRGNEAFHRRSSAGGKCFEVLFGRSQPCKNCQLGERRSIESEGQSWMLSSFVLPLQSSQKHYVNVYRDLNAEKELEAQWTLSKKMGALGELAGNLAHELNNPLSGLKSLAQFWISELQNDGWKSDLKEIEKATTRSQTLIQNLLAFSQGRSETHQVFEFDEMVKKTLPLLKGYLRELRLEVSLEAQGLKVFGDPVLLQQVIYNLVKNGAQAQKSQGLVELSSRAVSGGIQFTVRDSGDGIRPEDLHQIFQPFFSTKPKGQGSGLGLFFSKNVIEKMGGEIGVSSTLHQGTQVWFKLPLHQDSL